MKYPLLYCLLVLLVGCSQTQTGPRAAALAFNDALLRSDLPTAKAAIYAKDPLEERGVDAALREAFAEMEWVAALTDTFGPEGRHMVGALTPNAPELEFSEASVLAIRDQLEKAFTREQKDGVVIIFADTKPKPQDITTLRSIDGVWKVTVDDWIYPRTAADFARLAASTQRYHTFALRVHAHEFPSAIAAREAWRAALAPPATGPATTPANEPVQSK